MKFAVIGDPISHSLSPLMHNKNFESLDLKFTYEAVNVPIENFKHIR
ncbi:shikimate dehydrogenase, partial [Staphylococcus hominis]